MISRRDFDDHGLLDAVDKDQDADILVRQIHDYPRHASASKGESAAESGLWEWSAVEESNTDTEAGLSESGTMDFSVPDGAGNVYAVDNAPNRENNKVSWKEAKEAPLGQRFPADIIPGKEQRDAAQAAKGVKIDMKVRYKLLGESMNNYQRASRRPGSESDEEDEDEDDHDYSNELFDWVSLPLWPGWPSWIRWPW